ncbi:hypothetical protein BAE44_0017067 [Dichanthelium oligosanthes]|uniref:Fungal lipase-like domain-containing protein n=1 Tax=Dichanthelium oligosanthes TaxID=888268 RepID=A0A1E5V9T3_9POAL|nr:hypothetical protein BAE44_0017067 [Dichanthelium oligosanthes]
MTRTARQQHVGRIDRIFDVSDRCQIIGHSMGAGIAALTYMLREYNKFSSSSCIDFGPGKDFITTVVNRNDLVPSFGKASAAILRAEVMASSWAPDLQEQMQGTRILGFVNSSVNFMQSHIPFLPNPGPKVAYVNMLLSDTPVDELKLSADAHAAVQKHSVMSCWPSVAANRQTLGSLENQPHALLKNPTVRDQMLRKLIRRKKTTDQEHMEHLLKSLRSSSTIPSHPHQLYPSGRIMHMVVLSSPEEQSTGRQHGQDEVVAIY